MESYFTACELLYGSMLEAMYVAMIEIPLAEKDQSILDVKCAEALLNIHIRLIRHHERNVKSKILRILEGSTVIYTA